MCFLGTEPDAGAAGLRGRGSIVAPVGIEGLAPFTTARSFQLGIWNGRRPVGNETVGGGATGISTLPPSFPLGIGNGRRPFGNETVGGGPPGISTVGPPSGAGIG